MFNELNGLGYLAFAYVMKLVGFGLVVTGLSYAVVNVLIKARRTEKAVK